MIGNQHMSLMDVNRKHPRFDFSMELLCILPKYPVAAMLCDIMDDLDLDAQHSIVKAIEKLRKRGLVVGRANKTPNRTRAGRCAWLDEGCWDRARAIGERYWQRVYGDD